MTEQRGLAVQSNSRVLIVGKTGSGKTFLARSLLAAQPRLVIIDGKGLMLEADWNASRIGSLSELDHAFRQGNYRVIITPTGGDLFELPLRIMREGDCVVYVDEAYSLFQGKAGRLYNELWTRGREHGIGIWAATQRPTWISLFVLSESEHYFVFRLTWIQDRERMRVLLELDNLPILKEHSFIYAHPESSTYIRVPILNLTKSRNSVKSTLSERVPV